MTKPRLKKLILYFQNMVVIVFIFYFIQDEVNVLLTKKTKNITGCVCV